MQEQVFINCVAEDIPRIKEIEERLELAGITFTVSPAKLTPALQKETVEKIQAIAAGQGGMLCVLSQRALADSAFISNIQLICETAGKKRVLVNYAVEPLENDQNIRLFASQAYQVKQSGRPSEEASEVIRRIQRILHPSARNILAWLPGIISRKALTRLVGAVALVGVIASVSYNLVHKAPPAPAQPTPTPVLIYTPFINQSQDAGLKVIPNTLPDFKPESDPALEAPFAFKPNTIFEQDDFNDPAFDGAYDGHKWMINYNRLESAVGIAVSQANGVLQLGVAPTGDQQTYLTLNSKYMFNPGKVTYLGFRFRLNDYRGTKQENTFVNGNFTYQFIDIPDIFNLQIDGLNQSLNVNNAGFGLGSGWHTLELVSQADKHRVDISLDGKKINTLKLDQGQFDRWAHANFSLSATGTDDWVSLQIDQVVFGGDTPLAAALQPEDAPYRFTPDTVDLHEDFNTALPGGVFKDGGQYLTQSAEALSFRVPAGQDEKGIQLVFPSGPINQDNYYAMRFRFSSPDDDYWADWATMFLNVTTRSSDQKIKDRFDLHIGAYRHEYAFTGGFGINGGIGGFPFGQYTQPSWHTLEMLLRPPDEVSKAYTAFFWMDGFLIGERSQEQVPAAFLDANTPVDASILIKSGSYRQESFSCDLDNLLIGRIAGDKIKE